jgi:hypothetical protein
MMARQLNAVRAEMAEKDAANCALRERVANLAGPLPLLVVEGETDKTHIEAAWSALRPGRPLPVQVSEWGGMQQIGAIRHLNDRTFGNLFGDRRVLVLVDDDCEGRAESASWFAGKSKVSAGLFRSCSRKNASLWARLPATQAYQVWARSLRLKPEQQAFVIEHLFADEVHQAAIEAGVLAFRDNPSEATLKAITSRRKALHVYLNEAKQDPMLERFVYPLSPNMTFKVRFAGWASHRSREFPETYACFESVVASIEEASSQP